MRGACRGVPHGWRGPRTQLHTTTRPPRAQKARGKQKHEFFKRTRTGQPVMKHRMDKLLQALQQSVA